jgi:hypothetical protein
LFISPVTNERLIRNKPPPFLPHTVFPKNAKMNAKIFLLVVLLALIGAAMAQQSSDTVRTEATPKEGSGSTVCTDDVQQCPDGTYVGRDANCQFRPCPDGSATTEDSSTITGGEAGTEATAGDTPRDTNTAGGGEAGTEATTGDATTGEADAGTDATTGETDAGTNATTGEADAGTDATTGEADAGTNATTGEAWVPRQLMSPLRCDSPPKLFSPLP